MDRVTKIQAPYGVFLGGKASTKRKEASLCDDTRSRKRRGRQTGERER